MKSNRKNWLVSAAIMIALWVVFGVAVVMYAQWQHPEVFEFKPAAAASQPG